ncbi:hypothetical protein C8Q77DRAFT_862905 [Trametes polyzona]|nr:hypothetical protein C8Q77DRAFT_862905 [Trametes polyzona]
MPSIILALESLSSFYAPVRARASLAEPHAAALWPLLLKMFLPLLASAHPEKGPWDPNRVRGPCRRGKGGRRRRRRTSIPSGRAGATRSRRRRIHRVLRACIPGASESTTTTTATKDFDSPGPSTKPRWPPYAGLHPHLNERTRPGVGAGAWARRTAEGGPGSVPALLPLPRALQCAAPPARSCAASSPSSRRPVPIDATESDEGGHRIGRPSRAHGRISTLRGS